MLEPTTCVGIILLDVSEAILDAINFLNHSFRRGKKLVKNFGPGGALLSSSTAAFVAPIRKNISPFPCFAEATLVFPIAGTDNFVDHRAIVAWGVAEQPGSRPLYSIGRKFTGMFLYKLLNY